MKGKEKVVEELSSESAAEFESEKSASSEEERVEKPKTLEELTIANFPYHKENLLDPSYCHW